MPASLTTAEIEKKIEELNAQIASLDSQKRKLVLRRALWEKKLRGPLKKEIDCEYAGLVNDSSDSDKSTTSSANSSAHRKKKSQKVDDEVKSEESSDGTVKDDPSTCAVDANLQRVKNEEGDVASYSSIKCAQPVGSSQPSTIASVSLSNEKNQQISDSDLNGEVNMAVDASKGMTSVCGSQTGNDSDDVIGKRDTYKVALSSASNRSGMQESVMASSHSSVEEAPPVEEFQHLVTSHVSKQLHYAAPISGAPDVLSSRKRMPGGGRRKKKNDDSCDGCEAEKLCKWYKVAHRPSCPHSRAYKQQQLLSAIKASTGQ